MAAFLDNCRFNPTLGGTTDWTYSSAATGYQDPVSAGAVTTRVYECFAISATGTQWEISRGACTIAAGVPTFARTTVLYNSSATGTAAGQSGAGTKISFAAAPQVAVVAIKESLISIEEANSFSAAQRAQARSNISAVLKGQLFGLTFSTAGASTSFSIAAGEAADSTGVDLLVLASAISKTTATTWVVGSGNGGLDTGGVTANTWYHIHLIKRPDTGVVDVLFSLSATAPTMPTNYTLFRRIGSIKTNGSSQWVAFSQLGDEFLWTTSVTDQGTVSQGTTAVLYTLSVPTGIQVTAIISILSDRTGTNGNSGVYVSSPDQNDEAVSGAGVPGPSSLMTFATAAAEVINATGLRIRTDTSGRLRMRASTTTNIAIQTYGYVDRRGRDS